MVDGKFKTLEDISLKEIDNVFKELEGYQCVELEMIEAITSLESLLMEWLSI